MTILHNCQFCGKFMNWDTHDLTEFTGNIRVVEENSLQLCDFCAHAVDTYERVNSFRDVKKIYFVLLNLEINNDRVRSM